MADEKVPPTAETPTEPAEAKVPLAKFKELEERYSNLEASLRALQQPPPQRQQQPPVSAGAMDRLAFIAQRLNSDVDTVKAWDPMLSTFFEAYAQPYVNAMAGLADKIDRFEARSEIPDFDKFAADIDAERTSRLQRGEYLAPREAYHLVRSRKLPEILEQERARALDEMRTHTEVATQAGETISTTETKAGPSPTKPSTLTRDSFSGLSIEEKEKALENMPI